MPGEIFTKLSTLAQNAVGKIAVKSALNPLLWLCGTGGTLCFGAAYLFRQDRFERDLLIGVGILPIVLTCVIAAFFAFFKPEKLQSEEFQLRQQTLSIIEEKGGRIKIENVTLEKIAGSQELSDATKSESPARKDKK